MDIRADGEFTRNPTTHEAVDLEEVKASRGYKSSVKFCKKFFDARPLTYYGKGMSLYLDEPQGCKESRENPKTLRCRQESVVLGFGNDSALSDEKLDITVIQPFKRVKRPQETIGNILPGTQAMLQ